MAAGLCGEGDRAGGEAASDLIQPAGTEPCWQLGGLFGSFHQLFTSLRMSSSELSLGRAVCDPFIPTFSMCSLWGTILLFMHVQYSKSSFIQIGFMWQPQVWDTSGNKGKLFLNSPRAWPQNLPCSSCPLLGISLPLQPPLYQAPSCCALSQSNPVNLKGLPRSRYSDGTEQ